MAVRIFDVETWRKLRQPDLNSKMYYINKSTGKKFAVLLVKYNMGIKKMLN
jgi:hypothetical protein